jgi:hypothetical protein
VVIRWARYPNFTKAEFPKGDPNPYALDMLQEARTIAGVPFILSSSVRPGDDGAHGRGLAFDIKTPTSRARFRILKGLIEAGFHRIGVYDHHIHADCDDILDPEVCWWGKSR